MSSSFYLSFIINKIWYCLIFLFFIYSLWKYSKNYKSSFILGNLQVAFLTSLSIFTLAIYDIVSKGNLISNGTKMVFIIIIIYCGFSFITTLMREILKDIEDIEGDRRNDANTLAIKYDINKTKKIVSLLTWIPIVGIGYFQYFQYSVLNTEFSVPLSYWGVNIYSVSHMFVLQLLLFFLLCKIYFAKSKSDFHYTSALCKIIMLVGILAIPLNYFLHI
jgi:4-hydroxybenzoate polyprenyltransferase